MTTDVVILAQGTQKRMGLIRQRKQLLPLPHCGNAPIMARTVAQIWYLAKTWPTIVAWDAMRFGADICVEGTEPVAEDSSAPEVAAGQEVRARRLLFTHEGAPSGWTRVTPAYVQLDDPGNSALKGIARYLEQRSQWSRRYETTVVLLGDVVYSWRCLSAIFEMAKTFGFVGTSDLSSNAGELWGIGWSKPFEDKAMADLRDALLRHPAFEDEYQPGQLRRWITAWQRGDVKDHVRALRRIGRYTDIDDYTRDIDLPAHLETLPILSLSAARDDAEHQTFWEHRGLASEN